MSAALSDRMDRIKEIVCEHLELDAVDVTETSSFREDHEADSLSLMDVLAALEKEYGVEIDDENFAEMVDVRSAYGVVAGLAGW
ncbi:MAG TPA: acyl carrier protein [Pseudonocardiaceae bacterium]|jgi:acyl carrier protein|nr:acyl carrier protein [Pseudonocardiaceae bacterium]